MSHNYCACRAVDRTTVPSAHARLAALPHRNEHGISLTCSGVASCRPGGPGCYDAWVTVPIYPGCIYRQNTQHWHTESARIHSLDSVYIPNYADAIK